MRSTQETRRDAGDTVPESPLAHDWRHTGNGVVFFDTCRQHRGQFRKASSRGMHWTVVAIVFVGIALSAATAIAFDWVSPDQLAIFTSAK
jgi:hypothetical protein